MSRTVVQSYLNFGGRCDEALEFYRGAIGAQVEMLMRFNESPEPAPPGMLAPGFDKKVMHCSFKVGETVVMASDGCEPGTTFSGISLALSLPTEPEVQKAFNALAEGGKVKMPLAKTFWSASFGMLTDKFGLDWMVMVCAPQQ